MSDRQPEMPSHEEMLTAAQHRIGGGQCWTNYLDAPAASYLKELMAIELAHPGRVNRNEVRRQLVKYFGVDISPSAVKKHFARECQCDRA